MGKTDGTIMPGEDVIVSSDKIKIAPDDEAGMGMFFVDEASVEHPLMRRITENLPPQTPVPCLGAH
jgi:NADPH-dependent ferric siderophore reductase